MKDVIEKPCSKCSEVKYLTQFYQRKNGNYRKECKDVFRKKIYNGIIIKTLKNIINIDIKKIENIYYNIIRNGEIKIEINL